MKVFTIGHSALEPHVFIDTLKLYGINKLIDVRSHPGSRHVPWCNKEVLPLTLKKENIAYAHFLSLGGRRKNNDKKSLESADGWKNASFKSYACYTMTDEYEKGIDDLINESKKQTVCIMCAENVPWKCHRLLISNTLMTRGVEVFHIINKSQCIKHRLNLYGAYAMVDGGKVIYPIRES